MINIVLCDDDANSRKEFGDMIVQAAKNNKVDITISTFQNGETLLFHMCDLLDFPDIIYIDVLMGSLDGIQTAKHLRAKGCKAQIIFLTSCEEFVFDSFDVFPVHYLLKDEITFNKFEEVFLRAVNLYKQETLEMLVCKSWSARKLIAIKDISHFEIWRGIITVYYAQNERFEYRSTMDELESQLKSKDFFRVHRSFIVNFRYVVKFHNRSILLKGGKTVPVGVTYQEQAEQAFEEFIHRNNTYF